MGLARMVLTISKCCSYYGLVALHYLLAVRIFREVMLPRTRGKLPAMLRPSKRRDFVWACHCDRLARLSEATPDRRSYTMEAVILSALANLFRIKE